MTPERINELRFKNSDCGHFVNSVIDECLDEIEKLRSELQKLDGRWACFLKDNPPENCIYKRDGNLFCRNIHAREFMKLSFKDLLKDCPKVSNSRVEGGHCPLVAGSSPVLPEGVDKKPQPQLPEKLDIYDHWRDIAHKLDEVIDYLHAKENQ